MMIEKANERAPVIDSSFEKHFRCIEENNGFRRTIIKFYREMKSIEKYRPPGRVYMEYRIKDPDTYKNINIIEKEEDKKNKFINYVASIGASTLDCYLPKMIFNLV